MPHTRCCATGFRNTARMRLFCRCSFTTGSCVPSMSLPWETARGRMRGLCGPREAVLAWRPGAGAPLWRLGCRLTVRLTVPCAPFSALPCCCTCACWHVVAVPVHVGMLSRADHLPTGGVRQSMQGVGLSVLAPFARKTGASAHVPARPPARPPTPARPRARTHTTHTGLAPSSSLMLEWCYAWKGVCIDPLALPDTPMARALHALRPSCELVAKAIT